MDCVFVPSTVFRLGYWAGLGLCVVYLPFVNSRTHTRFFCIAPFISFTSVSACRSSTATRTEIMEHAKKYNTHEQAYAWALQDALETSYESIAAWSSVLGLFLSPLWQLLVVLGRALLPHVLSASTAMWRFQASLPLSTLCAEAAVIVLLVLLILLRRFIARRRYVPRAQRSIRLFRARINRRYLSFTAAVERNFRLSARAFPHVMYWAMVGLIVWVAPESTTKVRDKLWIWVTVTWPALYALYLVLLIRGHKNSAEARRESGGGGRAAEVAAAAAVRSPIASSPGSPTGTAVSRGSVVTPGDVDRVLMYWVVFTVGQCCSTLAEYVPFAGPMLQSMTPPSVRTAAFFVFVWMHLPGPGSGLQVGASVRYVGILVVVEMASARFDGQGFGRIHVLQGS